MTTLLMRICAISRASFLWCGLPLGTKIFVAFHNWPYQKRTMAQEASIIQNKLNWVQMRCLCQRLKYQIDMILIFEWSNLAESEDIGLNFSLHFFSIFSPLCHKNYLEKNIFLYIYFIMCYSSKYLYPSFIHLCFPNVWQFYYWLCCLKNEL